jgi:hypothetical protein
MQKEISMRLSNLLLPTLLLAHLPLIASPCLQAKGVPAGKIWKFHRSEHSIVFGPGSPMGACPYPACQSNIVHQPLYQEGTRTVELRNGSYTSIDSLKGAVGFALRGNEPVQVQTYENILPEELTLCDEFTPVDGRFAYGNDSLLVSLTPEKNRIALIYSKSEGVLYSYRFANDTNSLIVLRIEDKNTEAKLAFINGKYQGSAGIRTPRTNGPGSRADANLILGFSFRSGRYDLSGRHLADGSAKSTAGLPR